MNGSEGYTVITFDVMLSSPSIVRSSVGPEWLALYRVEIALIRH